MRSALKEIARAGSRPLVFGAAILVFSSTAVAQGATASEPPSARADVDGHFTYGLGNGSALGGQVHALASFGRWRIGSSRGSIAIGAIVGYINEPIELQPWNANTSTTGTTHRIPFALTLGHSFHFGASERVSFGLHGYAGAVHWISRYRVRFPSRGIEGEGFASATVLDVGAMLRFTWRPHPVIGLSLQMAAPIFGVSPETLVGLFTVAGGITVRLR